MEGVIGKTPRKLDQFFTLDSVADECVDFVNRQLNNPSYGYIVEPSSGGGAFVKAAKKINVENLIHVDIDAKDIDRRKDFLKDDVVPSDLLHASNKRTSSCLVLGNPPFGKNSSLALSFFNKSATFADVIAFIVPKTFIKASVQNRLCRDFHLHSQMDIDHHGFVFNGSSYDVPCVFQIWVRNGNTQRSLYPVLKDTDDFSFVKATEAPDIAIRRVGVNAGRIFTQSPETCSVQSHMFLKAKDGSTKERINKRLLELDLEHADCKYHTAGCPSIGKSELCDLYVASKAKKSRN